MHWCMFMSSAIDGSEFDGKSFRHGMKTDSVVFAGRVEVYRIPRSVGVEMCASYRIANFNKYQPANERKKYFGADCLRHRL